MSITVEYLFKIRDLFMLLLVERVATISPHRHTDIVNGMHEIKGSDECCTLTNESRTSGEQDFTGLVKIIPAVIRFLNHSFFRNCVHKRH